MVDAFGGFFGSVAGYLLSELNDDAVMQDAVNRSGGGHRVFEDLVPLRKDQVGGDHDTAAFIAFGEQGEEHFHLFSGLLDVADVVKDQDIEAVEFAELLLKQEVPLGTQQVIDEAKGRGEEHAASTLDQFVPNCGGEVSFPSAGQAKNQQILTAVYKIACAKFFQLAS